MLRTYKFGGWAWRVRFHPVESIKIDIYCHYLARKRPYQRQFGRNWLKLADFAASDATQVLRFQRPAGKNFSPGCTSTRSFSAKAFGFNAAPQRNF
jgi:hypothetical protein